MTFLGVVTKKKYWKKKHMTSDTKSCGKTRETDSEAAFKKFIIKWNKQQTYIKTFFFSSYSFHWQTLW